MRQQLTGEMSEKSTEPEGGSILHTFAESDHPVVSFARDLIWVVGVVAGIALLLFVVSGTWPAVVAIESESMVPNMNVGDLVFVVEENRFGELRTWEEGEQTGYAKFADQPDLQGKVPFGDVIIYRPNGDDRVHPIIHRALLYEEGSPEGGYITKGDNNPVVDQNTFYPGIGVIQPVKDEWIIGKAFFSIPLVGYLPLNILPLAIVIIIVIVVHEILTAKKEEETKGKGKKKKGKR
jgi:signal peptidase